MKTQITMTTKKYSLTASGKGFKSKPENVEKEIITETQFDNITNGDTRRFFKRLGGSESVVRSYTCDGYRVVELTSKNPSRDLKIVRSFDFDRVEG